MSAVRTLPVGELSVRGRAEKPPPGGGSIAAAVEAFLTVAPESPPERPRADEPSGTHRASDFGEVDEEDLAASDTEARDRSVVDAVLAMLGPSPVAQLLRMPAERLRGGTGGADPASAKATGPQPTTSDRALGGRTLRDLGIVSEGLSIASRLPSGYPTVRPATPRRSLSDLAMEMPNVGASGAMPTADAAETRPEGPRAAEPPPGERGDALRAALDTAAHRARSSGSSREGRRATLPPDTVGRPKEPDAPKTLPAPVLSAPRPAAPSVAHRGEATALATNAIAPNAIAPAVAPNSAPSAITPGSVVVTEAVVTGLLRPKGAAPESPHPRAEARPRADGPRADASRADAPRADALDARPRGDAPRADAGVLDASPRADAPRADAPVDRLASERGDARPVVPARGDEASRDRPTHERRTRRDEVHATGRSVEATRTETAAAVQAPDAVRPGTPALDVPLAPVSTHEAPSPSLAPSRESLVHDPYDSMFPERPPLAAASFLDGSVLPGAEGASTRLELQHPTLGALTLHLAQVGDGVNVDFSAPTLDAAIALRASEEGLRAELRESGAELGGFRVRTRRAAIAHEGDARETEAWQPAGRHDRRRV